MNQDEHWAEHFRAQGHPAVVLLGRGMEGVVHDLGDGLVGKVWFQRAPADLKLTQEFQQELFAQHLPYETPLILQVDEVDGHAVTLERRLPGTPLSVLVQDERIPRAAAYEAALAAVTGLATTQAGPAARALAVLDETTPLWAGHERWTETLAALVRRRAAAHSEVLRARITDFDEKLLRVRRLLERVPPSPDRILHGDLVPANILVDDEFRVTAVIDWSFLTTAGDHAFEASVTAGIFDMYGPGARVSDDALTAVLVEQHGHPLARMLLYRAAYAIATANAFSSDGADGHFAWCAAVLEREDVVETLFSANPDL
ncbi:phosphotransferase family protein [Lentzea nigeriaca]|uniref:phosphotransferase family protein n=1 Tax=Lentzea nigeriaca TaxID=1128665 RepID=UPI00195C760E|nr:phosphotransferase [Lentzea nigeriaca]MBM7858087.1 aminoglycoside phosphotransferase [Lentzea nigeriaca]